MAEARPPELPSEVLERIFSVDLPDGNTEELLLDTKQRLRCQLVCKAWQYALDARRWPLWRLELRAEQPGEAPPPALWVQRLRPGVRWLHVQLLRPSGPGMPWADSPAVEALHGALLALDPPSEFSSLACVPHLPAWPSLQSLVLHGLRPASIQAGHLALLMAAPNLRHLGFGQIVDRTTQDEVWTARQADYARIQVLRLLLPNCTVDDCQYRYAGPLK